MLPTLSTCQPNPLLSLGHALCLCLTTFTVTVCPPPLPPSGCAQVPVRPRGVCLSRFPPSPLWICLALPEFSSKSLHLLVLGFLSGVFLCEGERLGHLHSLAVSFPVPRSPRYLAMPAPLLGSSYDRNVIFKGSNQIKLSRIRFKISNLVELDQTQQKCYLIYPSYIREMSLRTRNTARKNLKIIKDSLRVSKITWLQEKIGGRKKWRIIFFWVYSYFYFGY